MQDENGPCPLLAIVNVLALQGNIVLSSSPTISTEALYDLLGAVLFQKATSQPSSELENQEHLFSEVLEVLPVLQTGLDVNLRFTTSTSFEFTRELAVFDSLNITLVHGWLIDPQSLNYSLISPLSYNQAVERSLEDSSEGQAIKDFLEDTQSQLTYYGLSQLYDSLKPDSLYILFRNNHFSTLYKDVENRLFVLVTDTSFTDYDQVVWEELVEISGDTRYMNDSFTPSRFSRSSFNESEERDRQLAMELQRYEQRKQRPAPITQTKRKKSSSCSIQ